MNHIHNTSEKKRITLNYLNQPVADNGKLRAQFSSFLGTTVRQFVSLTCASWHQVPEKELLWEYVKVKYVSYLCLILFDNCKGLYVPFYALCVILCRTSILFLKMLNRGLIKQ